MALSGLLLSFFNETDYLALYLGQLGVEDYSVVYSFSLPTRRVNNAETALSGDQEH